MITVSPNESEPAGPPRALYPKPYEPGAPFGEANNVDLQMRILRDALQLMRYPAEPGTIITKDYCSGGL